MDITRKLADLGWILPAAPKPIAAYLPAVRSGNWLFVSGQLPTWEGKLIAEGKVPLPVPVEMARHAAAQCAVNALAIVDAELGGDWDRFLGVVRMGVLVQSLDNFYDQAKVANGASELLQQIFGQAGRHTRVTMGVNALPLNAAVEAEFLFEIR